MTFNVILVFLALNLFIAASLSLVNKIRTPTGKYKNVDFTKIYPELTQDQINELLTETWGNGFIFEPLTGFRERPMTGKYVNVAQEGFRRGVNQGPWPPNQAYYNIFVLGGSTTFGYGIQDTATIPSLLQELMPAINGKEVKVYNFGRGFYYSTQERVLFEKLLLAGLRPDAMIFIDGLNESLESDTYFDPQLSALFNNSASLSFNFQSFLAQTPLFKSFSMVWAKFRPGSGRPAVLPESLESGLLVKRYLDNKKMVEASCRSFDIRAVFVWQPVPTYKYDLNYHDFADSALRDTPSNYFSLVKTKAEQGEMGANFIWSADLQKDKKLRLYVDSVHYNELGAKMIASHIAEQIQARGMLQN